MFNILGPIILVFLLYLLIEQKVSGKEKIGIYFFYQLS
ncbi:hypothetical protein J2Z58_003819 [Halobacillus andaensis]|nr:hypothetical protein [Halobacillus andaensis]